MRPTFPFRFVLAATALALVAAACGGDDGEFPTTDAAPVTVTAPSDGNDNAGNGGNDETDDDGDSSDGAGDADGDTGSAAGGFDPGDIGFRVVNLLEEPVDLYVRTSGLVEAYLVAAGVGPTTVTELSFPPANGIFLITEAGAGDATCVSGCDHFIAELSTFAEDGPVRTVLLYTDEFGQRRSFDLWEQPDSSRVGNANAMVDPDPTTGLAVVVGAALREADFGLRLSLVGTSGCAEPVNVENILVGGNQTPVFALGDGPAAVLLHRNDDRECADAPVGGPFSVESEPGSRSFVFLSGAPDAMDAIVVPMVAHTIPTAGGGSANSVDVERAVALFAEAVELELGFPPAEARCASEVLVDAIGADVLLDGDRLVDLDALPLEVQDAATDALIVAIGRCDIDPALLGD